MPIFAETAPILPWRRLQAFLVGWIKSYALALLHRSSRGETLVLQTYLGLEESGEGALLEEVGDVTPSWLEANLKRQCADEARHAALFRERLAQLGVAPRRLWIDPLSKSKVTRLRRLIRENGSSFGAGRCVPALATVWRMEITAVRVLGRHVDVLRNLAARGASQPSLPILEQVLADERSHVRSCEAALERLVTQNERKALTQLVAKVDSVDRAFGIVGALAMVAVGLWLGRDSSKRLPEGAEV